MRLMNDSVSIKGLRVVGEDEVKMQLQSTVGPQGPAGPQGAQGERGPQGVAGPQGPAGADGKDGQDGSPGANGKDGADGKTPVKGTDYFTAADKEEMVNAVIAALPVYAGEVADA